MDRLTWAKKRYEDGTRAYWQDGEQVYVNGGHCWGSIMPARWEALRAYQDEQRKKGVPIILSYQQKSEWCGRDYKEFVFLLKSDDSPVIAVGSATEGYDWSRGEFTNFRWRAGYPKKASGFSDDLKSLYPFHKLKGGQNA